MDIKELVGIAERERERESFSELVSSTQCWIALPWEIQKKKNTWVSLTQNWAYSSVPVFLTDLLDGG